MPIRTATDRGRGADTWARHEEYTDMTEREPDPGDGRGAFGRHAACELLAVIVGDAADELDRRPAARYS